MSPKAPPSPSLSYAAKMLTHDSLTYAIMPENLLTRLRQRLFDILDLDVA